LQRNAQGKFDDVALAEIIYNAINTPAHSFGARGVPECMRVVEIMTIEQNRAWGCCTLNEFRKFFGLKPLRDFKEWNPDPAVNVRWWNRVFWQLRADFGIQEAAQALYGHIDRLELHVGLQGEAAKPPMPGAGLCPGYTVSRAILADGKSGHLFPRFNIWFSL
jgi:linoleate 10R-lipoxygenase